MIDITATITDNVNNAALNGGTATLTIDYGNGNTYTQTVDVEDGQAIFKDVKLENPGDYSYKVEYSRFNYNHHDEGINDYLPSEAESKLHILALNTTVSNESATGKPGDKVKLKALHILQKSKKVKLHSRTLYCQIQAITLMK